MYDGERTGLDTMSTNQPWGGDQDEADVAREADYDGDGNQSDDSDAGSFNGQSDEPESPENHALALGLGNLAAAAASSPMLETRGLYESGRSGGNRVGAGEDGLLQRISGGPGLDVPSRASLASSASIKSEQRSPGGSLMSSGGVGSMLGRPGSGFSPSPGPGSAHHPPSSPGRIRPGAGGFSSPPPGTRSPGSMVIPASPMGVYSSLNWNDSSASAATVEGTFVALHPLLLVTAQCN